MTYTAELACVDVGHFELGAALFHHLEHVRIISQGTSALALIFKARMIQDIVSGAGFVAYYLSWNIRAGR